VPLISGRAVDAARATDRSPLRLRGPTPKSLGAFIGGFKAASTKRINQLRRTPGSPVWQRGYYERIIRDERELLAAQGYVEGNPMKWGEDRENPDRRHAERK
jgi:putative transposase